MINSFVSFIKSVKSYKGLAMKSNNLRNSELVGTIALHYRKSNIAFSHLIMSSGANAKQLSYIIDSNEK